VTDRGRPIAVLGPAISRVDLSAATPAGWLTAPSRQGHTPVPRQPAIGTVLQALAEDRGA